MKKNAVPVDVLCRNLNVMLRADIVRDLERMEANTHQPVADLVTKALLMFIATHRDYLKSSDY